MTTERRHDPYGAVHKGIRAAHMRCLVAIGAADADDARRAWSPRPHREDLAMCGTHLEDENAVLHVALDARRPGASAHAAEDHDDHLHSFRGACRRSFSQSSSRLRRRDQRRSVPRRALSGASGGSWPTIFCTWTTKSTCF